jgi:hypothetical protein
VQPPAPRHSLSTGKYDGFWCSKKAREYEEPISWNWRGCCVKSKQSMMRGARVGRPQLPEPPDIFYKFQDAAELVLLVLDEARTAFAFSRVWRHDEHRNAKARPPH